MHSCTCGLNGVPNTLARSDCVGTGSIMMAVDGTFESTDAPYFGGFYGPCSWVAPQLTFDTMQDALLVIADAASFRWSNVIGVASGVQGEGLPHILGSREDVILLPVVAVAVLSLFAGGCVTALIIQVRPKSSSKQ